MSRESYRWMKLRQMNAQAEACQKEAGPQPAHESLHGRYSKGQAAIVGQVFRVPFAEMLFFGNQNDGIAG